MVTQEIQLAFSANNDINQTYDELYQLLGLWRQSGQIIGKGHPIFENKNSLSAVVMTLENSALSDENTYHFDFKCDRCKLVSNLSTRS